MCSNAIFIVFTSTTNDFDQRMTVEMQGNDKNWPKFENVTVEFGHTQMFFNESLRFSIFSGKSQGKNHFIRSDFIFFFSLDPRFVVKLLSSKNKICSVKIFT